MDDLADHIATLHRALGFPPLAPPDEPKIIELLTRKQFYPPGSLGAAMNTITAAFNPRPNDG